MLINYPLAVRGNVRPVAFIVARCQSHGIAAVPIHPPDVPMSCPVGMENYVTPVWRGYWRIVSPGAGSQLFLSGPVALHLEKVHAPADVGCIEQLAVRCPGKVEVPSRPRSDLLWPNGLALERDPDIGKRLDLDGRQDAQIRCQANAGIVAQIGRDFPGRTIRIRQKPDVKE